MDIVTIIIIGLIVVVLLIAGLAWGTYKAGFRVEETTVKTPVFEAKMKRNPTDALVEPPAMGPEINQQASGGGVIAGSGISAPADSAAKIEQQAKDKGSKIDDSPIKLT